MDFIKANGGCGYVKKPDFLMQTEPEVFDPRKPQDVKKILKVYLVVCCLHYLLIFQRLRNVCVSG
jgi:hypothetical protein